MSIRRIALLALASAAPPTSARTCATWCGAMGDCIHAYDSVDCSEARPCINFCCAQAECAGCGPEIYCSQPDPPASPSPPFKPAAPPAPGANRARTARAARQHLRDFLPAWTKLFLVEGTDPNYPMPAANEVTELLPMLRGVRGIAVHSTPGTTVTEAQGYAMFLAGMQKDVATLKALTVAWQANGQGFGGQQACGGCCANGEQQHSWAQPREVCASVEAPSSAAPNGLCKTVRGAYMPAWRMPMVNSGSMGSATDADEDAITGLIYLAELTGDAQARAYALKSIAAFVLEDLGYADPRRNSRRVPEVGEIPPHLQTIWLWRGGTCWGGYDSFSTDSAVTDNRRLCLAPAYFSPGQWRLFSKYVTANKLHMPPEVKASADELIHVLESAVVWGYNLLSRIACDSGMVSNWWTLPQGSAWPWASENGLVCHNSATAAGEYGADAVRIPWRVALDYIWFPEETMAVPLFDEAGRVIGTFGAKEYSNRWARAWKDALARPTLPSEPTKRGSYPPLKTGAAPLRPDQVLQPLVSLPKCSTCPQGFTASPWNAWGGYPIVTSFMVPIDGVSEKENQEWLDFISERVRAGLKNDKYFDAAAQVIVASILAGDAWLPSLPASTLLASPPPPSSSPPAPSIPPPPSPPLPPPPNPNGPPPPPPSPPSPPPPARLPPQTTSVPDASALPPTHTPLSPAPSPRHSPSLPPSLTTQPPFALSSSPPQSSSNEVAPPIPSQASPSSARQKLSPSPPSPSATSPPMSTSGTGSMSKHAVAPAEEHVAKADRLGATLQSSSTQVDTGDDYNEPEQQSSSDAGQWAQTIRGGKGTDAFGTIDGEESTEERPRKNTVLRLTIITAGMLTGLVVLCVIWSSLVKISCYRSKRGFLRASSKDMADIMEELRYSEGKQRMPLTVASQSLSLRTPQHVSNIGGYTMDGTADQVFEL